MKGSKGLARVALLTATLLWGSSFAILKNTLDSLPMFFILAFRFLVAGAVLCGVFYKKLRLLNMRYVKSGVIIGGCLFMAYWLQTVGLAHTTPGKNAFLTAVYCIIVPFMFWAVDKTRPDKYNIIAAITCLVGIGLVSLTDSLTVQTGDYMTLFSGFFWAAHIIAVSKLSQGQDPVLLTIMQFFMCGLCSAVGFLLTESVSVTAVTDAGFELFYLTVLCTAVTLLCQNWGQKRLPPSNAAILLSLESVFGVLFSVILYHEQVTPRLAAGFCLIFAATIISETKLSFLKKKTAAVKK